MLHTPEIGDTVIIESPVSESNNIRGEILAIQGWCILLQLSYGRTTIEKVYSGWKISERCTLKDDGVKLIKAQKIRFADTLTFDNAKITFPDGSLRYFTKVDNCYFPVEGVRGALPIELIPCGGHFRVNHSSIIVSVEFTKSFNRFDPSDHPLNQFDYGYIFNATHKRVIKDLIRERFHYYIYLNLLFRGCSKYDIEKWDRDLDDSIERFYQKIIGEIDQKGCIEELQDHHYQYELLAY